MDITVPFALSLFAFFLSGGLVYAFGKAACLGIPFAVTAKGSVKALAETLTGTATRPDGTRKRVADLGSGDGRILIALAREGFEVHGFEVNPILVFYSRRKIRKAGLQDRAFVHQKNFWKEDISSFDVVVLFGISYLMNSFEKKLQDELPSGAMVVSNLFKLPHWKPTQEIGNLIFYTR